MDKARDAVDFFKQTLGAENFFLELQNHGIPEQAKVNKHLIQWSKEFGLKLVATNDVHYVEKSHSHAHDCLVCIGTQSLLSDPKRMSAGYVPEQFYLRSAEEMKARFAEVPEAVLNTLAVAEKCNLEIPFPKAGERVFIRFLIRRNITRAKAICDTCWRKDCSAATPSTQKRRAKNSSSPALMIRKRLPTFDHQNTSCLTPVAAAIKTVIDRVQTELKIIEKQGLFPIFSSSPTSCDTAAVKAFPAWRAVAPPVPSSPICWRSRTWIRSATPAV